MKHGLRHDCRSSSKGLGVRVPPTAILKEQMLSVFISTALSFGVT